MTTIEPGQGIMRFALFWTAIISVYKIEVVLWGGGEKIVDGFKAYFVNISRCKIRVTSIPFVFFENTYFFDSLEQKGELPPGRTVVTSSNNSFRDPDIEMELNELRQKRKNF
jgi:hypothetical protein